MIGRAGKHQRSADSNSNSNTNTNSSGHSNMHYSNSNHVIQDNHPNPAESYNYAINERDTNDNRIEEIYRKFKNDTGYTGHGPHANYDQKQQFSSSIPPTQVGPYTSHFLVPSSDSIISPAAPSKRAYSHHRKPHTELHTAVPSSSSAGTAAAAAAAFYAQARPKLEEIPQSPKLYERNFSQSIDTMTVDTAPSKSDNYDDDDELDSDLSDDLDSAKKLHKYADKEKLTAKEKNREHAKNTRMRKKNYIESLKDSIKQMNDEREKIERERKVAFTRLQEQVLVRKKVLQEVLDYRVAGILDAALWGTLIEESIIFVLPVTPYRSFPPLEVYQGQRYIRGIPAVLVDTSSFYVMLQTIVPPLHPGAKVKAVSSCDYSNAVFEDQTVMCTFDLKTTNALEMGCRGELTVHGMVKAVFSPYNKLIYFELTFDVMMFMQQLRRASGRADFHVIANTPYLAQDQPNEARIITESIPPYRIVYVSEGWQHLVGYRREQILGKTCKILQGEKTEKDKVSQLMDFIRSYLPCTTIITNYTSSGQMFPNWIRIYPLYSEGVVTHFLGIMENLNFAKFPTPAAGALSNKQAFQYTQHNPSTNVNNSVEHSGAKGVRPTAPATAGVSSISLAFRQAQLDKQRKASGPPPTTTPSEDSTPKPSALTKRLLGAPSLTNSSSMHQSSSFNSHNSTENLSTPESDDFLFGLLNDVAKDSSNNSADNFNNLSRTTLESHTNNSHQSNAGENSSRSHHSFPDSQANVIPNNSSDDGFYGDNAEAMMLSDGEESLLSENLLSY